MAESRTLDTLKKRTEFLAVAASGKRWVAPGFILQIGLAHDPVPQVRLGITASRKVGGAVVRNRAKRRLRALAGQIMTVAAPEHDYVLVARSTTPSCGFDDMKQDLETALRRLKVWRG